MTDINALTWTAAELLTDVRQKARIPPGSIDYTDTVLLNECTRALWSFAGWAMSKAADGRLTTLLDRSTMLTSPYGGAREVDLPPDALGDTFDSVVWVDGNGFETRLELIQLWDQPLHDSPNAEGKPWGFAVVDGRIRLYPRPVDSGSVRIAYQRRHAQLVVDTDRYKSVGAFTPSTSSLSFTCTAPAPFGLNSLFDVIVPYPPYRYAFTNAVASGTPASGAVTTFSYTSTTFAGMNINGYTLVQAGDTPYVHLPLEFKQCLTQKIAAQVVGEIGDVQGALLLEQKAEAELGRVLDMLNPRSQTTRTKVVNPYSHLRAGRIRRML